MIKYTEDYIAKLLDKYMEGTSTLEEEDVLAEYFRHSSGMGRLSATFPGDRKHEACSKAQVSPATLGCHCRRHCWRHLYGYPLATNGTSTDEGLGSTS